MAKKAAAEEDEDDEDEIEKQAAKKGSESESEDEDTGVTAKVPHKIKKIKIESSGISSKNMKFMSNPREVNELKKVINQNKGKKFLPYWDNEVVGEYAVEDYRRNLPNAYDWDDYPPSSYDQYRYKYNLFPQV